MREEYWIIKSTDIDSNSMKIANEYLRNLKLANKAPLPYTWLNKFLKNNVYFFRILPIYKIVIL